MSSITWFIGRKLVHCSHPLRINHCDSWHENAKIIIRLATRGFWLPFSKIHNPKLSVAKQSELSMCFLVMSRNQCLQWVYVTLVTPNWDELTPYLIQAYLMVWMNKGMCIFSYKFNARYFGTKSSSHADVASSNKDVYVYIEKVNNQKESLEHTHTHTYST